jgi:hypothetical protein
MPFAFFGSSTCSQMATRNPFRTSLVTYPSAAWWGTPHIGMLLPLASFDRDVSVSSSARAATSASS